MSFESRKSFIGGGAIAGVLAYFLWQFWIIRMIILVAIVYFGGSLLYDKVFTQATADPSTYNMVVLGDSVRSLEYSRNNPQFTVDVEMTNSGKLKISKWTLYASLYDCPSDNSPIDACEFVTRQGLWMTDVVRPGSTVRSHKIIDFWDADNTQGSLRLVYTVGSVTTDSDTNIDERQESWRQQLKELQKTSPRN